MTTEQFLRSLRSIGVKFDLDEHEEVTESGAVYTGLMGVLMSLPDPEPKSRT